MELMEMIKLFEAAQKLANFWGVEVTELLAIASINNEEKTKEWNKLATEIIGFYSLSLEERAEKFGLTLTIKENV